MDKFKSLWFVLKIMTLQSNIPYPIPILSTNKYLKDVAFYIDSKIATNKKGKELLGKIDGVEWNFWNMNLYWQHLRKSDPTKIYPGSRRWSEALLRSKKGYTNKEIEEVVKKFNLTKKEAVELTEHLSSLSFYDMSCGHEIVNTVIAFPVDYVNCTFSRKIRIPDINGRKNPVVIDEPIVVKKGGSLYLELDKQNSLSQWFEVEGHPKKNFFEDASEVLGLPKNEQISGRWESFWDDHLRCMVRPTTNIRYINLGYYWCISNSQDIVGFRLGNYSSADVSKLRPTKYVIYEQQRQIILDVIRRIKEIPEKPHNEVSNITEELSNELKKLLSELYVND